MVAVEARARRDVTEQSEILVVGSRTVGRTVLGDVSPQSTFGPSLRPRLLSDKTFVSSVQIVDDFVVVVVLVVVEVGVLEELWPEIILFAINITILLPSYCC